MDSACKGFYGFHTISPRMLSEGELSLYFIEKSPVSFFPAFLVALLFLKQEQKIIIQLSGS